MLRPVRVSLVRLVARDLTVAAVAEQHIMEVLFSLGQLVSADKAIKEGFLINISLLNLAVVVVVLVQPEVLRLKPVHLSEEELEELVELQTLPAVAFTMLAVVVVVAV